MVISYRFVKIKYERYSDLSIDDGVIIAGNLLTILWIVSVIGSPTLGYLVDKIACRSILNMISALLGFFGHILMIFMYPIIPLILIGLSYCTNYAAIWASIAYVTEYRVIGKAYGTVISLQNLGLVFSPFIVAYLKIEYQTYDSVIIKSK